MTDTEALDEVLALLHKHHRTNPDLPAMLAAIAGEYNRGYLDGMDAGLDAGYASALEANP